ncbi:CRAL/TRIO domain-containing protein [Rozella allomycis CSF55]|uniref:CRAL-TRIO domain-containing protein n=1 Tax=Rozella allomycis (strain CSF55) TaxID=988480 RepID=A0A075AXC2_ROZAC|nr:CRAL-TRIO domain-containing protein [Rozella allomycis CSF55]RKP19514.1 CRAL/TRIO domain-containing protein [Rozella allomycis CSF55]|eukprot:EPZ33372.1 CRAL-TRIO domain-containing protein [Rozella allomycis CSF55]
MTSDQYSSPQVSEFIKVFNDNAKEGLENSEFNDLSQPNRAQICIIEKFLVARNRVVNDAVTMFINALKVNDHLDLKQWRKQFRVNEIIQETFDDEISSLGFTYGFDKNSRPITYNVYGKMDPDKVFKNEDTTMFLRWRVQLMERAIQLLDFENGIDTITQVSILNSILEVHDYAGASMFRMDKRMKAITKEIITLFQDNYPEMLQKKMFINVPSIMDVLYNLMAGFTSKRTQSKFLMASYTKARKALLDVIDVTQVPIQYGGFEKGEGSIKTADVSPRSSLSVSENFEGKAAILDFCVIEGDIIIKTDGNTNERREFGSITLKSNDESKFTFEFDNSFSMLNGKQIIYRLRECQ